MIYDEFILKLKSLGYKYSSYYSSGNLHCTWRYGIISSISYCLVNNIVTQQFLDKNDY